MELRGAARADAVTEVWKEASRIGCSADRRLQHEAQLTPQVRNRRQRNCGHLRCVGRDENAWVVVRKRLRERGATLSDLLLQR